MLGRQVDRPRTPDEWGIAAALAWEETRSFGEPDRGPRGHRVLAEASGRRTVGSVAAIDLGTYRTSEGGLVHCWYDASVLWDE